MHYMKDMKVPWRRRTWTHENVIFLGEKSPLFPSFASGPCPGCRPKRRQLQALFWHMALRFENGIQHGGGFLRCCKTSLLAHHLTIIGHYWVHISEIIWDTYWRHILDTLDAQRNGHGKCGGISPDILRQDPLQMPRRRPWFWWHQLGGICEDHPPKPRGRD